MPNVQKTNSFPNAGYSSRKHLPTGLIQEGNHTHSENVLNVETHDNMVVMLTGQKQPPTGPNYDTTGRSRRLKLFLL